MEMSRQQRDQLHKGGCIAHDPLDVEGEKGEEVRFKARNMKKINTSTGTREEGAEKRSGGERCIEIDQRIEMETRLSPSQPPGGCKLPSRKIRVCDYRFKDAYSALRSLTSLAASCIDCTCPPCMW